MSLLFLFTHFIAVVYDGINCGIFAIPKNHNLNAARSENQNITFLYCNNIVK